MTDPKTRQRLLAQLEKPRVEKVCTTAIPLPLRSFAQWVPWRFEWRPLPPRWSKVPIGSDSRRANIMDPNSWSTFDTAISKYEADALDGIGFVFSDSDPFSGIDLDKCINRRTTEIEPWAKPIIVGLNSYTELSPSLRGVKVLVEGQFPEPGRKQGPIEIYSSRRFFTITGLRLPGLPPDIEKRQQEMEVLYQKHFAAARQEDSTKKMLRTIDTSGNRSLTDAEIVSRAKAATNGEKFARLWAGDTEGLASGSEADLALCSILAFWTGGEPDRIDRLFRQSGLYRDKWEREDYRLATIEKAVSSCKDFYQPQEDDKGASIEGVADPHRLARVFLARYQHPDARKLHFYQGEWYAWHGAAYEVWPEEELSAALNKSIKRVFDEHNRAAVARAQAENKRSGTRTQLPKAPQVTSTVVNNSLHALRSSVILPGALQSPCWLGGNGPFPASEALPVANGVLHLPSAATDSPVLHPATPRFFSRHALTFDFDPNAPEPARWLEFLRQLWPKDPKTIALVQEWFGYCLLPDTSQQKILLLVGPKRSGKGTIAGVLTHLVGTANTVGPTFASLGSSFGLWPLLGKTLAIIDDARLSARSDTAIVTERLLSISGEGTMTVERKYLPAATGRLSTRLVILTNELPRLSDASGALASRFLVLRLTESFYGKEDRKLLKQLLLELPSILLWAIRGWHQLQDRGHFVQPRSGQEMLEGLEGLVSPILLFIREKCFIDPEGEVEKEKLWKRWLEWCREEGRTFMDQRSVFFKNVLAAVPNLQTRHKRIEGKGRCRVYVGIRLRMRHERDETDDENADT